MLRLTSNIEIKKQTGETFSFDFVNDIQIESSRESLTEKVTLVFPKNVQFEGRNIAGGDNPLLLRGDQITIQLGYDDKLTTEFTGYISKVEPNAPVTVECENEMFKFKETTIKKLTLKDTDLKELLNEIVPSGITFKSVDAKLGNFRVTNATPSQVLEEIKKTYRLPVFFRDGVLYVGLTYWDELVVDHKLKFERNVISNDLQFRTKDEMKIKVKAISMLPDNTKLEKEVGDPDGEQRTLNYYNIKTEKELKERAESEIERLKYTGYSGSLTTFGEPTIKHQHVVELLDDKFPERDGKYFVKKHSVQFGTGGFRRVIELDFKTT